MINNYTVVLCILVPSSGKFLMLNDLHHYCMYTGHKKKTPSIRGQFHCDGRTVFLTYRPLIRGTNQKVEVF